MKPLLPAFLIMALTLPAAAEDPPAEPAKDPAPAEEPAGDATLPDPAKEYAAALDREKSTGKPQVWDGMKMVDAPEGFQNPMTEAAMAAGWRPVVVNGETMGACNGSMCTSSALQPDLFGPPQVGTAADNADTAAKELAAKAAAENGQSGEKLGDLTGDFMALEATLGEDDPNFVGPKRPPQEPTNDVNERDVGKDADPEALAQKLADQGNKGDTEASSNEAAPGGNRPPTNPTAYNPLTGLAFNDDGNAFTPRDTGGGGQNMGMSGMVGQDGGPGAKAINCAQAGNCRQVAENLISFHEGLRRGPAEGPRTQGTDTIAAAAANLRRKSPTLLQAEAMRDRARLGVAAAVGELSDDGAVLADQGAYETGVGFDGTGAKRAAVPTKKCGKHIMEQVGICPE